MCGLGRSEQEHDHDGRHFAVLGERLQEHYGHPLPFNELMAEMGRKTERDLSIGELVSFLASNLSSASNS
jgi:acyl carrier protein